MISGYLRKKISRHFTKQTDLIFHNKIPSYQKIEEKFEDIKEFGIYLHIPFCNQICPYCPYNKEIYNKDVSENYVKAVKKEIDTYASFLKNKPVTTFYIGGGTPTTMLNNGIDEIINHIYKQFNMNCYIHMESHPNHLTKENLNTIEAMGVKYLSIGVESLQDKHLKAIERPYTVSEVKKTVERALGRNFECVNIDYIFDLPGQTKTEIEQAGKDIIKMGVDQIATYPLFKFPYTKLGKEFQKKRNAVATMFRRRSLLKIFENIFYDSGYERSSVWAFTKKGLEKYCSVTVPLYLGLGASGGSYLKDVFYVNTFKVNEYIKAVNKGKSPAALSIDLSEDMQMAAWLYWRIYETKFKKSDFQNRFHTSFDKIYGKHMKLMNRLGYINNGSDQISLSDRGTYWIHAFEDFFSIDFINKLWGTSKNNPWPDKVLL